jgi:hypothetical protein
MNKLSRFRSKNKPSKRNKKSKKNKYIKRGSNKRRFYVMKGVFRPETTSGLYLARYLANHKENYLGKNIR